MTEKAENRLSDETYRFHAEAGNRRRIQLRGALQIADRAFLLAVAIIDIASELKYFGSG